MFGNVKPNIMFGNVKPNNTFGNVKPNIMFGNVKPDIMFGNVKPTTAIPHVYTNGYHKRKAKPLACIYIYTYIYQG